MGGTTHKLRPSPYLLQVTSRTLFFPVWNYPPHTFCSERTPESHNLTQELLPFNYITCLLVNFWDDIRQRGLGNANRNYTGIDDSTASSYKSCI